MFNRVIPASHQLLERVVQPNNCATQKNTARHWMHNLILYEYCLGNFNWNAFKSQPDHSIPFFLRRRLPGNLVFGYLIALVEATTFHDRHPSSKPPWILIFLTESCPTTHCPITLAMLSPRVEPVPVFTENFNTFYWLYFAKRQPIRRQNQFCW